MGQRHIAFVAGAAALGLLAFGAWSVFQRHDARVAAPTVDAVTPSGVLLKDTKGTLSPAGVLLPGPLAYADVNGTLAYISDAACTEACRAEWAPVAAPTGAQPFGDWTVIDGEGRQWAYKGHALFVPRTPKADASYKTCAPDRRAHIAEWCVALFVPDADVTIPDGIFSRAITNANGIALTDHRGLTLYGFDGDVARDGQSCLTTPCDRAWTPVAAPALALPRGDFTIVKRPDGTKQWAFKGRALYSYEGDTAPEDVMGVDVDSRWSVALIAAFPTPPGIAIRFAPGFGTIWTNAAHMTLYSHHRGGDRRRGQGRLPFPPDMNCDAACREDWTPVVAAADAQGSGYWTLATLPDGARQWLYRDLPLYTYRGDTQPGDMKGEFQYNFLEHDAEGQIVGVAVGNPPFPSRDMVPDFWRPAFPF